MSNDLYEKTITGFILFNHEVDVLYPFGGEYHDPLVEEFLAKQRQRARLRKALLCIMFGWFVDEASAGSCPDFEATGNCACQGEHSYPDSDWPLVAVFDYRRTSSLDWGEGAEWYEVRVSPCDEHFQVNVGWCGYP